MKNIELHYFTWEKIYFLSFHTKLNFPQTKCSTESKVCSYTVCALCYCHKHTRLLQLTHNETSQPFTQPLFIHDIEFSMLSYDNKKAMSESQRAKFYRRVPIKEKPPCVY